MRFNAVALATIGLAAIARAAPISHVTEGDVAASQGGGVEQTAAADYRSYGKYSIYGKYGAATENKAMQIAQQNEAEAEETMDKTSKHAFDSKRDPDMAETSSAMVDEMKKSDTMDNEMEMEKRAEPGKREDYAWYPSYNPYVRYTEYGSYPSAEAADAAKKGMAEGV